MQDPDDIEGDPDFPPEVAEARALRAEAARAWAALLADDQFEILQDYDDLDA